MTYKIQIQRSKFVENAFTKFNSYFARNRKLEPWKHAYDSIKVKYICKTPLK